MVGRRYRILAKAWDESNLLLGVLSIYVGKRDHYHFDVIAQDIYIEDAYMKGYRLYIKYEYGVEEFLSGQKISLEEYEKNKPTSELEEEAERFCDGCLLVEKSKDRALSISLEDPYEAKYIVITEWKKIGNKWYKRRRYLRWKDKKIRKISQLLVPISEFQYRYLMEVLS